MNAFLDTSSLLKLYHHELGTEELIAKLASGIEIIYLSELAILEFRSAIWKKARMREIDTETADRMIICFHQDFAKFQWIEINNHIIQQAQHLLMKYGLAGLRTLDAIQLACALTLKGQAIFLTADKLLESFLQSEGVNKPI